MSYRLEISLKDYYTWNANIIQTNILKFACKSGCEKYYKDYDIEGYNRQIKKNNVFIIIYFPEDTKHIITFLNYIKNNRNVYVESIGFDNIKFTLLYASKMYQKNMDKDKVKEYSINRNIFKNINFKNIIEAI